MGERRRTGLDAALVSMRMLLIIMATALATLPFLCGCGVTSRPVSVDSVSGTYRLYPHAMGMANEALSDAGMETIPEVVMFLGDDGDGFLSIAGEEDGKYRTDFWWRLDGGAKNPEILLSLTDPASADDKMLAFLMMLESDPTHTKIRGNVAEGEVRLRQSAGNGHEGTEFVFAKDGTEASD